MCVRDRMKMFMMKFFSGRDMVPSKLAGGESIRRPLCVCVGTRGERATKSPAFVAQCHLV